MAEILSRRSLILAGLGIAGAVELERLISASRPQPVDAQTGIKPQPQAPAPKSETPTVVQTPQPIETTRPVATVAAQAPTLLSRVASLNVRFPIPQSFRPEDANGVKNFLLENAPEGRWFHPMTKLRSTQNQTTVWSYEYYFAFRRDNVPELVQHGGEEGVMFFRHGTDNTRLLLGVGLLDQFTDDQGVNHDLRGDIRTGFSADLVPSIWIRSHPNIGIRVFDPDSGQPFTSQGGEVIATTSEAGDIGFGLGDCGRVSLLLDQFVDPGLETIVWKGVHDRPGMNWMDLRPMLQCIRPTVPTKPTVLPTAPNGQK